MAVKKEQVQLNVGDKVYAVSYEYIHTVNKIDRVTHKFAFSGNTKFRRGTVDGYVDRLPKIRYDTTLFCLETEELKQQLHRQKLENYIKVNCDVEELTTEQLEQIKQIIDNK